MSLDDKLIEAGFSDLTKSFGYGLSEEEEGLGLSKFKLVASSLEESLDNHSSLDRPENNNLIEVHNFAYQALKYWTKESLELTGNILAKYIGETDMLTGGVSFDDWRFEYLHNNLGTHLNSDWTGKFSLDVVNYWDQKRYISFESKLIENMSKSYTLRHRSFSDLPLEFVIRNKDQLIASLKGDYSEIFNAIESLNEDGRFKLFSKDILRSLKVDAGAKKIFMSFFGTSTSFESVNPKINHLRAEILDLIGDDLELAEYIIGNCGSNLYNSIGIELASMLKQDAAISQKAYALWTDKNSEVKDLLVDGICSDIEIARNFASTRNSVWWENGGNTFVSKLLEAVSGNFDYLREAFILWRFEPKSLSEKDIGLFYTAVNLDTSKYSGYDNYCSNSSFFTQTVGHFDKSPMSYFLKLPSDEFSIVSEAFGYAMIGHFEDNFFENLPRVMEQGIVSEWAESIIDRCNLEDKDVIGGDKYRIGPIYSRELEVSCK